MAPNELLVSEQLTHSTTRIECTLEDGSISTGTGFFYAFARDGERHIPAIVTNRHVIEKAVATRFNLTLQRPDGGPLVGQHLTINLDYSKHHWFAHSNTDVDLCAMPIAPLIAEAKSQKRALFYIPLDETLLPTDDDLRDLGALEDIVMVGYPNGIWDSTNNMPILRRGVTATHPHLNYEGREEFMIDAACFPGSSGSPVFLFNTGGWTDRAGNMRMGGTRIKLLGVLYAGPQYTATGEVKVVNVPTQQRVLAFPSIPINLGVIIKSKRLRDFESMFRALSGGNSSS